MSNTEFKDNSTEAKSKINEAINKWLTACGEMSISHIKPLVPVDTGNLRSSIDYKINEAEKEVLVGTNEHYAIYVEYGTGVHAENGNGRKTPWIYRDPKTGKRVRTTGSRPKPYMRPGFRVFKPIAKDLLIKYVGEAVGNDIGVTFNRNQYK